MAELTPMLRQYYELKKTCPDALLLFHLGDFYELFSSDAVEASAILGITLTARNKGTPNEMPMCGIPIHSSETYINKLSKAGKKVAIAGQVSDPALPGIVERKVIRIITPGTLIGENMLDAKTSNYIASFVIGTVGIGFAYADISTGKFYATLLSSVEELSAERLRVMPSELVLDAVSQKEQEQVRPSDLISFWNIPKNPQKLLQEFFKIPNLKVFYIENDEPVLQAASLLLDYILDTQRGKAEHITRIERYNIGDTLALDISTLRNLEIFRTLQGQKEGSLLSVIDKTVTASGARKLHSALIKPLNNKQDIEERLKKVEAFYTHSPERGKLREVLSATRDIERILAKVSSERANPRDLLALRETLDQIPKLQEVLKNFPESSTSF